jgi:DNA-binding transcriptional regulator YiaG
MKKARLDRGMLQRELADLLRVHRGSIQNWEQGRAVPAEDVRPAIEDFIAAGGMHRAEIKRVPPRRAIGRHLYDRRLTLGLSLDQVATLIGTSKSNVHNWERDYCQPRKNWRSAILQFLAHDPWAAEVAV